IAWTAGSGLALSTALASNGEDEGIAPLTRAFSNMLETRVGHFATTRLALSERTNLSFGMSHARNANVLGDYMSAPIAGIRLSAAAMRLDYAAPLSNFSLEMGSALEEGAVLGSTGTGALNLAERSASVWIRLGGDAQLGGNWSLKASTSFALTNPDQKRGNLGANFTPIISSTASFGFVRNNLFSPGDALSLTLHQPLRAERAHITLFTAGIDPVTGAGALQNSDISLTPSGREIAFELGYSGRIGVWVAQANIAFRHDAGHVAGEKSGAAMIWLSRWF
ncbi:MAG: hypothetical protein V3S07_00185, partial [Micropepsaceae bacterium]